MELPSDVKKYFRAIDLKNSLDAEHKELRARLKELVRLRHNARVNEARIWKSLPSTEQMNIQMGFYDEPDYDEEPDEVTPPAPAEPKVVHPDDLSKKDFDNLLRQLREDNARGSQPLADVPTSPFE